MAFFQNKTTSPVLQHKPEALRYFPRSKQCRVTLYKGHHVAILIRCRKINGMITRVKSGVVNAGLFRIDQWSTLRCIVFGKKFIDGNFTKRRIAIVDGHIFVGKFLSLNKMMHVSNGPITHFWDVKSLQDV